MENKFKVNYQGKETLIEQQPGDEQKNIFFKAHLPAEEMLIEYTEDDEGTGRWLDAKTHNQTDESAELGKLIDVYAAQHHLTIK